MRNHSSPCRFPGREHVPKPHGIVLSPGKAFFSELDDSSDDINKKANKSVVQKIINNLSTMSSDSSSSSEAESEVLTLTAPITPQSKTRSPKRVHQMSSSESSSDSDDNSSNDTPQNAQSTNGTSTTDRQQLFSNNNLPLNASRLELSPKKALSFSKHNDSSSSDEGKDSQEPPPHQTSFESSFTPPSDYVKLKQPQNTLLTVEDLKPQEELWLMSVPADFDINELNQKPAMFDGSISIKSERDEKDDDIKFCWEIHAHPGQSNDDLVVLLPSKKHKSLQPVQKLTGQLTVTKSLQLKPYSIDTTPIQRGAKIPEGLVMRNIPFGSGAVEASSLYTSIGDTDTRKEKKKKKKSKKQHDDSQEETPKRKKPKNKKAEKDDNSVNNEKKKKKHKKHKKLST